MATSEVINIDSLVQPLAGENPAGVDLRADFAHDAPFSLIRGARNAARSAERARLEGMPDAPPPDWRPVLNDGPTLIAEKSKDLDVAAWLIEALVREYGFAGLRDGFRLYRELVERYWESAFPQPDPDSPEDEVHLDRLATFVGLNGEEGSGTLIEPILNISIVGGSHDRAIGVLAFEQARILAQIDDANERALRIRHGIVPLEEIEKAVNATSSGHFAEQMDDLRAAMAEFEKLCTVLEGKCGLDQAPPSSDIRNAMDRCANLLRPYVPADGGSESTEEVSGPSSSGSAPAARSGPVQSREKAFDQLREIARFFRETEPHSVLSWQLEECVRWGKMTLPELLSDLIADEDARDRLFKRVGIPKPEESDN
ncbi:MAG: type VI secretion system protein TssA [Phycisphaerae bacterium]